MRWNAHPVSHVLFFSQKCTQCLQFFCQSWPTLDTCTLWVLSVLHTRWCGGITHLSHPQGNHGWWRWSRCHQRISSPLATLVVHLLLVLLETVGVLVGGPSQRLWWILLGWNYPLCGTSTLDSKGLPITSLICILTLVLDSRVVAICMMSLSLSLVSWIDLNIMSLVGVSKEMHL